MDNNRTHPNNLLLTGAVLRDPNVTAFDASKPYRYCRICGAVYQTETHREPPTPVASVQYILWNYGVEQDQVLWSVKHAEKHSLTEHWALANSGLYMTPEASRELAAYGIVSLTDLVLDSETNDALANAPSTPSREVVDR